MVASADGAALEQASRIRMYTVATPDHKVFDGAFVVLIVLALVTVVVGSYHAPAGDG